MKTPQDPRHKRREKIIRDLFAWSFQNQIEKTSDPLVEEILKNIKEIDQIIAEAAPQWPVNQINKVDLAILRLAVFELVIQPKEPPKVIIDEAIELAKTYGSERSFAFVNGVLGTIFKRIKKTDES
ncbi:MAG: transcription antitermination factor NusB [Microgenomates group bacterium]